MEQYPKIEKPMLEVPSVKASLSDLMTRVKPNPGAKDPNSPAYRMVFIDGCNFLCSAGHKMYDNDSHATGRPNARAALILIHAFLKMGFEVVFVTKKVYKDRKNTLNHYVLEYLAKAGVVQFLDDEMDDDREILINAQRLGGIVISNDRFAQDKYRPFDDVINSRRIGFSCISDGDYHPFQSLFFKGRFDSDLQIFLHKSVDEFKQIAICQPLDLMFGPVKYMEMELDANYCNEKIMNCEFISDYHRLQHCYILRSKFPSAEVEYPDFFDFEKNCRMPDTFDEFYDIYISYSPLKFSNFGTKK